MQCFHHLIKKLFGVFVRVFCFRAVLSLNPMQSIDDDCFVVLCGSQETADGLAIVAAGSILVYLPSTCDKGVSDEANFKYVKTVMPDYGTLIRVLKPG